MTQAINTNFPQDATAGPISRLGRNDPLLQELWAVKAALNAESGYRVERRAEQSRAFDLEATLACLRQQTGH